MEALKNIDIENKIEMRRGGYQFRTDRLYELALLLYS